MKHVHWDFSQDIEVGDTVEFPNDPASYAVLAINEDGIVVKKLEVIDETIHS